MSMSDVNSKILNGLERIAEVFKTLLWEKAKVHGISPIQIQIILFVANHPRGLSNVSYLAKEFNVTKATISDAVRVLLDKGFLEKDHSPADKRRYNLDLTTSGKKLSTELSDYHAPLGKELVKMSTKEQEDLFQSITNLIYQLHLKGIIQTQRTCFNCRFYQGDKMDNHSCNYLNKPLLKQDIRLDCGDFSEIVSG